MSKIVLIRYLADEVLKQSMEDGIYIISEIKEHKAVKNTHILNLIRYFSPIYRKAEFLGDENPIKATITDPVLLEDFENLLISVTSGTLEDGDRLPLAFSVYDFALLFIRTSIAVLGKKTVLKSLEGYDVDYGPFTYRKFEERIKRLNISPIFYRAANVEVPKVVASWAK